ncbi:Ubiquitin-conjugating enzyme e2, partial [Globisporangium splendens]
MASAMATKRLRKEYLALQRKPVENIIAVPQDSNILEWHYVITGTAGSPYEGGHYHGCLKFPPEYPMKPPAVYMTTPNGRFKTNQRLCLSMSDFHPETWNPMWSVSSILTGLYSFMRMTFACVFAVREPANTGEHYDHRRTETQICGVLTGDELQQRDVPPVVPGARGAPARARRRASTSEQAAGCGWRFWVVVLTVGVRVGVVVELAVVSRTLGDGRDDCARDPRRVAALRDHVDLLLGFMRKQPKSGYLRSSWDII